MGMCGVRMPLLLRDSEGDVSMMSQHPGEPEWRPVCRHSSGQQTHVLPGHSCGHRQPHSSASDAAKANKNTGVCICD